MLLDIKTAFLNASVRQLEGFSIEKQEDNDYLFLKALYGLRQESQP